MNYESIASEVGVSTPTIRAWLSVLEASYITFSLPCYYRNFGKRFVKARKVYFTDVGLCCYSSKSFHAAFADNVSRLAAIMDNVGKKTVVYSGQSASAEGVGFINYADIGKEYPVKSGRIPRERRRT